MDLSSLTYAEGSIKGRQRKGRGNGSRRGNFSGRGQNGYGQRSGAKSRPWMEGGTMPIYRRLPKRGFKNHFRTEYQVVNLDALNTIELERITIQEMVAAGKVKSLDRPVKILGNGEITSAKTIVANAFSTSAQEKIEKAGGKVELV
ncbi:MAG: 50S ribosomal protein L15 [Candidatus Marinimicrobia bacterium]|nr:50S ribosomal protein L15 [Candidatus Neomarinimicrobiota bacterium]